MQQYDNRPRSASWQVLFLAEIMPNVGAFKLAEVSVASGDSAAPKVLAPAEGFITRLFAYPRAISLNYPRFLV